MVIFNSKLLNYQRVISEFQPVTSIPPEIHVGQGPGEPQPHFASRPAKWRQPAPTKGTKGTKGAGWRGL